MGGVSRISESDQISKLQKQEGSNLVCEHFEHIPDPRLRIDGREPILPGEFAVVDSEMMGIARGE
jgi:hypothetical protein